MLLISYDLRGIFKKDLTFNIIYKATSQFFSKLKIKKAILGIDSNKNNFLIKEFLEKNFNLEFIGILPTPIFYYQVIKRRIPGIMITASHLPLRYSGLKFILKNGEPWKPYILKSQTRMDYTQTYTENNLRIIFSQTRHNKIIKEYFDNLSSLIKPKNKIYVCFDKKNFFLNSYLPYFRKLKIYHQNNSPIKVKSDLDNDRIFVYIKNKKIHQDLIFYYLAFLLQYKKLGVPIFFSQKLRQRLIKNSKKIYFIPTGHYYFKKSFQKYNLDFAFEPSGHFYMFKDLKTEAPYLALGLFLHSLSEITGSIQIERAKQKKEITDLEKILKLNNSLNIYRFDLKIKNRSSQKSTSILRKFVSFMKKKYGLKLKKFDGYLLFPQEDVELIEPTQGLQKNKNIKFSELMLNSQDNSTNYLFADTQSVLVLRSPVSVLQKPTFYLHLRKSKTENKLRISFEGDKKYLKEIKKWLMKI